MEKILVGVRNKKGAPMVDVWIEDVFEVEDDGDLSSWEIITRSDDDDDDEVEDVDFFIDDEEDDLYVLESLSSDLSSLSSPQDLNDQITDQDVQIRDVEGGSVDEQCGYDDYFDEDEEYRYADDDDEDDDGYEYDVDDELVPMSVSDRFGKQRLRKLGKRAYSKVNSSRKLPCYYHNRPKNGLGLNRNIL